MDVSLGTAEISSVSMQKAPCEATSSQAVIKPVAMRSMLVAAQLAQQCLMLSPLTHTAIASIFVARQMVPPARRTGPDRQERKPGDFLRSVKVAKSKAMDNQTQNRS